MTDRDAMETEFSFWVDTAGWAEVLDVLASLASYEAAREEASPSQRQVWQARCSAIHEALRLVDQEV